MRVRRPLAFGALVIIALGGMIGFAAFSTDAPTVPTTIVDAPLPAEAHGRVAAAAFAAMLRGDLPAPVDPAPASVEATSLPAAEPAASPTTTAATTIPPATRAVAPAAATTTTPPGPPPTTSTTTTPPTTIAPTTTTVPPTTTTAPPPEGGIRDVEEWRPLTEQYFPAERVDEALRVMECESQGDPTAMNPVSGASGLFQFMPSTWRWAAAEAGLAGADVFDPEANIAVAAWLVQVSIETGHSGGAWGHWTCQP